MADLARELRDLAEEVDEQKQKRSEAQGSLTQQLEALQEFGVSSVEEGEKKLAALTAELDDEEQALEDELKSIRENSKWSL